MKLQKCLLGLLMTCGVAQSAQAHVSLSESSGGGVQGLIWGYDPATLLVSGVSTQQYSIQDSTFLPGIERPAGNPNSTSRPEVLSASVSTGSVSSNVDGFHLGPDNPRQTSAGGYVDYVLIDLGAATIDGVFTLEATVNSNSYVSGDYGNFTRQGSASISYLSLTFDPTGRDEPDDVFSLDFGTVIEANTNLSSLLEGHTDMLNGLSILGISIVLNEQYGVCNIADFCEIGVNGLHVYSQLADDDSEIRLGVSYAAQTTVSSVPEADTYAMLLAGLGLVGMMASRRKS